MRRSAALCASAVMLWSAPCAAQTAYAPGQGSPNSIVLSVPVTASVDAHCGFASGAAPAGTYNQPDFDTSGLQHDFSFTLDCTVPLRVGVVSSNGGLQASAGALPSGYVSFAPYDVTLNLVGDSTSANATCAASTLTTGSTCASFLGPASTTQGLKLNGASNLAAGSYLRVSAPPYAGPDVLVAATYSDTLVVTLSASP